VLDFAMKELYSVSHYAQRKRTSSYFMVYSQTTTIKSKPNHSPLGLHMCLALDKLLANRPLRPLWIKQIQSIGQVSICYKKCYRSVLSNWEFSIKMRATFLALSCLHNSREDRGKKGSSHFDEKLILIGHHSSPPHPVCSLVNLVLLLVKRECLFYFFI